MVYKKQALYVYMPLYESGGAMFPEACGCMLFGLLCSQTVLIGYVVIRQCFYEPILLFPLPFITIYVTRYFRRNFTEAARQLSLERAVERDRLSDLKAKLRSEQEDPNLSSPSLGFDERRRFFDNKLYRQPVLTDSFFEPMEYRRNESDPVTESVQSTLRRLDRNATYHSFGSEGASPRNTGAPEAYRPEAIPEETSSVCSQSSLQVSPSKSEIV